MGPGSVTPVDGAEVGGWIGDADEFCPRPFAIGPVPSVFDRYARIFHPVRDAEGRAVGWAEVARRLGQSLRATTEWQGLLDPALDSPWLGAGPALGDLRADLLAALCEVIGRHGGAAGRCYFALGTVYPEVDRLAGGKPLLTLGLTSYVVLTGPLPAALDIGVPVSTWASSTGIPVDTSAPPPPASPEGDADELLAQSPNLIWPEDRLWFVSTGIESDSTVVGGDEALISDLLADTRFEALALE
jgi:hypothetical protein